MSDDKQPVQNNPDDDEQKNAEAREEKKLLKQIAKLLPKENLEEAKKLKSKEHKFWDNQPVPKIYENSEADGPIETKTLQEVQKNTFGFAISVRVV